MKKRYLVKFVQIVALVGVVFSIYQFNANATLNESQGTCTQSCPSGGSVSCEGNTTRNFVDEKNNDAGCICDGEKISCKEERLKKEAKKLKESSISLNERFRKTIEDKEKKFTNAEASFVRIDEANKGGFWKGTDTWRSSNDYVQVRYFDYDNLPDAVEQIKIVKNSNETNDSVAANTTRLRNLGDEAYLKNRVVLVVRKDKFVLVVESNDRKLAKRFAERYLKTYSKQAK